TVPLNDRLIQLNPQPMPIRHADPTTIEDIHWAVDQVCSKGIRILRRPSGPHVLVEEKVSRRGREVNRRGRTDACAAPNMVGDWDLESLSQCCNLPTLS